MKSTFRTVVFSFLSAAIFAGGCATSTNINTTPPGARVSLDERFLGTSPAVYQSRSGFPETHWVKLEAAGYRNQTLPIKKSYRADESLVLLLFGILPYFFSARFEDQENFMLEPAAR
jgi:hypothetical protein